MPLSLKDRGGRLQAFARHSSESNLAQNVNGEKVEAPKAPLEQPQPIAPVHTRQILDDSRAPPRRHTGTPRQSNGFQPPLRSPRIPPTSSPNRRPRANSEDRHGDIFSGSQLGEAFMNSGLTTPSNEPVEPDPVEPDPVDLGPVLARDLMNHIPSRQLPDHDRDHFPQSQPPAFAIRNDGRMAVIDKPSRHDMSHIGDGFRDNALDGYRRTNGYYQDRNRPGSPLRKEAKLPMREVRIRRVHAEKPEASKSVELQRSATPPAKPRYQPQPEREDQPVSVHDDDQVSSQDEHPTPRPKKVNSVIKKNLLGSSIPDFPLTNKEPSKKRRRASPEYDDMALSSMTFAELKDQPFDFDPSKEEEKPISTNADNVVPRLDQFRHLGEREQHALFANMSIEDWESSGEWFVQQFAGFVQDLTEARRNRRKIIQDFENEAASREEAVRLKNEAIGRKLSKMKQDGQRVVEDKRL